QRPATADDFQIVEHISVIRHQRGYGFAGINRAATAEADDEVAPLFFGAPDSANNRIDGRFSFDREHRREETRRLQHVEEKLRAINAPAGHDERAHPERSGNGTDLPQRARAKDDPGCGRKLKTRGWIHFREAAAAICARMPRTSGEFAVPRFHQPASSGNTLTSLTLVRGPAIIGATASRHFA